MEPIELKAAYCQRVPVFDWEGHTYGSVSRNGRQRFTRAGPDQRRTPGQAARSRNSIEDRTEADIVFIPGSSETKRIESRLIAERKK